MNATGRLLLAGVALAAAACASSDPTRVEEARLVGRWSWVEATGGIAGQTRTPASTGTLREVRLLADGRAELHENGERVRTTRYELGVGASDGSFAGRDVVRWDTSLLGGWDEQGVVFPHPDTLLLADGCCDGFVWTFARAGS